MPAGFVLGETSRMFMLKIEVHYEDIESLNKLNVTHTFRC